MNRLTNIFRIREWIASEIPILFIFIYSLILRSDSNPATVVLKGTAWIIFACVSLAFAYAINDLSDMEVDKTAGKNNEMSSLTPYKRMILLIGLLLAGTIVMFPWRRVDGVIPLVIIMFLTGYAYSMPPFRFKEKGVLGLLFSGIGQRTLPLILGMALFANFGLQNWILAFLFTVVGIRWIIVHQLIDFKNDIKAGVITFVTKFGYLRSEFIIKWVLFPLEIIAIAVWFYMFSAYNLSCLFVFGIYSVWLGTQWCFRLQQPMMKWKVYGLLPLTHFYSFFWPFILGILVIFREPIYCSLIFFQLFLHSTYLKRKFKIGFTKIESGKQPNTI